MVSDDKMLVLGDTYQAEYVTLGGSFDGPVMPSNIQYVNGIGLSKIDDNQAIITGGFKSYYGARDSAYYFDIQAESWSNAPNLITRRYDHVSGTLMDSISGQRIVVVAGGKKSYWNVLNSVETLVPGRCKVFFNNFVFML